MTCHCVNVYRFGMIFILSFLVNNLGCTLVIIVDKFFKKITMFFTLNDHGSKIVKTYVIKNISRTQFFAYVSYVSVYIFFINIHRWGTPNSCGANQ